MHLVFYATEHLDKTGAPLNLYYDEITLLPMTFGEIAQALAEGEEVHIRPAARHDLAAIANLEVQIAIVKATHSASAPQMSIREWMEGFGIEYPEVTAGQCSNIGAAMTQYMEDIKNAR